MSDANSKIGGTPNLHYLDLSSMGLAGRGGVVRLFLLRHGIQFTQQLESLEEWRKRVKAEVAATTNPMAHVPVLTLNGYCYTEHHAILRYLSKLLGEYGTDAQYDFQVDRTTSASNEMRDLLISGLFNEAVKAQYQGRREEFFAIFSTFRERDGGKAGHMVGDKPSFADDVLFALLWDDSRAFGAGLLSKTPVLLEFFEAYISQPFAREWCDKQPKQD